MLWSLSGSSAQQHVLLRQPCISAVLSASFPSSLAALLLRHIALAGNVRPFWIPFHSLLWTIGWNVAMRSVLPDDLSTRDSALAANTPSKGS